jgi:hypothetical protein
VSPFFEIGADKSAFIYEDSAVINERIALLASVEAERLFRKGDNTVIGSLE